MNVPRISRILSQATAIRGEERNFTRNGESCKGLAVCYTSERENAKAKTKMSNLRCSISDLRSSGS
jgi:hypothetical protein